MVLNKKKLKFKFRLKKLKKDEFKDFNINEIKFFFKIRDFNKKKEKKKKEKDEYFEFAGFDTEDKPLYIEKDLAKLRIKKWRFLNYPDINYEVLFIIFEKILNLILDLQGIAFIFR